VRSSVQQGSGSQFSIRQSPRPSLPKRVAEVHGERFFSELRRLGYIESENLIIERYSAEGHHERYADLAREIVASSPDLIVTGTNPVVIEVKAATSTIPIVAFMLDP
jgi:putative ABC transport system substrate-binding protein